MNDENNGNNNNEQIIDEPVNEDQSKRNWKRDAILFVASQTISLFGSSLVQFAIMWYITLETESGVMMMISIIAGALPMFLLSPFAGVWADRFDRKKLIMFSDGFIAVTTLILAIIFIAGYGSITLLFVASAFRAIGGAIQMPAVNAFIPPQIVPQDKLTRVQGLNGSIQSATMLLSPMLSGVLLTFATIEAIFFVDVVTAALAVLILMFFLHVKPHEKALSKQELSYFKDLKEGLHYIRDHGYLMKIFIFFAAFMFLLAPAAMLSPLQVARTFGSDVWRLTAIEIAFSLGMTLGGLLIASWGGGFRNKVHTMTFGSIAIAVGTIALGIVPVFSIYLIFMGLVGLSVPLFNTPSMVLLQEKVEPNIMGRVFGVMAMVHSLMMPLGMIVFGPISDFVQIEYLLIGTGAALFVLSFFLIGSKELMVAGEPT